MSAKKTLEQEYFKNNFSIVALVSKVAMTTKKCLLTLFSNIVLKIAMQLDGILRAAKDLEFVGREHVIYFLFKGNDVVYIGQSSLLFGRLGNHFRTKDFDKIKVLRGVSSDDVLRLEEALIKAFEPKFNVKRHQRIDALDINYLKYYNQKFSNMVGI